MTKRYISDFERMLLGWAVYEFNHNDEWMFKKLTGLDSNKNKANRKLLEACKNLTKVFEAEQEMIKDLRIKKINERQFNMQFAQMVMDQAMLEHEYEKAWKEVQRADSKSQMKSMQDEMDEFLDLACKGKKKWKS